MVPSVDELFDAVVSVRLFQVMNGEKALMYSGSGVNGGWEALGDIELLAASVAR